MSMSCKVCGRYDLEGVYIVVRRDDHTIYGAFSCREYAEAKIDRICIEHLGRRSDFYIDYQDLDET